VGCLGDSRVCTRAVYILPACTCGILLDNLHTCRVDLFKGQQPPPKKKNEKMKDGNEREANFYLLGPSGS
jgi:hypothetical protein